MQDYYWIQYGNPGHIGLFESRWNRDFAPDARVVCRTPRGQEAARVLVAAPAPTDSTEVSGKILRPFTPQDDLLAERLARHQARAFESCSAWLHSRGIDNPLIDVEQLHDGQHLFFYFLGPIDNALESILGDLAELYGQKIRFREFAERLSQGCGPGCGTTSSRCGTSGGCSSCSVASKCKPLATTEQDQGTI